MNRQDNERIAKLEVLVKRLAEDVIAHMHREEKERQELMEKISRLESSLAQTTTSRIATKAFVGGMIAVITVTWTIVTSIPQLIKLFSERF